MTTELLDKANQLENDIRKMKDIVIENSKDYRIDIVASTIGQMMISERLQDELAGWLRGKIEEYEKEFEEL